jgi:hypothetical protein
MNSVRIFGALAVVAMLAGCAGSVSAPEPVQAMSAGQKSALKIGAITADADSNVQMSDSDFGLVVQKVQGYIDATKPGLIADGAPGAAKMNIHFTRFDRGSAFARAMLIGLGQIRIEATVTLTDPSGATVGQYKVSKDFAIGGAIGATTTVEDVEDGFAKSVAEIVK